MKRGMFRFRVKKRATKSDEYGVRTTWICSQFLNLWASQIVHES